MKNIFQSIGGKKPQKSSFNLTHNRKFSFQPGRLYPTLCQEILPGDHWTYDTSALVRFTPMISPIMHMVDVFSYSFFVPDRLLMQRTKFEVFITGGNDGDGKDAQGATIEIPYAIFGVDAPGIIDQGFLDTTSLSDYLGIGIGDLAGGDTLQINMMPFIGFWLTWNEYFRDQNLHPDYVGLYPGIFQATGNITAAIQAAMTDVTNPFSFFQVPFVCWEKDYFNSALPFAQRGAPVETPLSGTASVTYLPNAKIVGDAATGVTDALGVRGGGDFRNINMSDDGTFNDSADDVGIENIDEVTLTSGGFTINALRLAARLQEWLEKMARGGARYIEQIRSQFGVVSSDARLQRPEYLAGGRLAVSISEVLQTAENGATPLAEMAGHAVAAGKITGFKKYFEEHGKLYSFIFLRPKPTYQNGTPRLWTNRFDKLDWAWPPFAHLGEQEVKQSEIYLTFDNDANDVTFGYQQRYAEYKYIPSTVHGDFKTTLDHWHWGIKLETSPTLSASFVECQPSTRIFNVIDTDADPMYCIVTNRITAVRPLPYQGEPYL